MKKKIKEVENNPNIMNLSNRDVIINKLTEILTVVMYFFKIDSLWIHL